MAGVNKVIILGRLGADPDVKTVGANATSVARLNIATSETWTKDGQKQERTEWHRVVVWNKLAEICGKHLTKGRQVYIEGKLQTRQWEDQQGQKRYATEILAEKVQFVGNAPSAGSAADNESIADYTGTKGLKNHADFGPEPSFDSNQDIPF